LKSAYEGAGLYFYRKEKSLGAFLASLMI